MRRWVRGPTRAALRRVLPLLVALLGLLVATAGADVGDYLGKPIASVRLVSEGRSTTDPRLLDIVETRVGSPLSMMAVRETVAHLFSLGRFDDVRVHANDTPAGVELLYELSPIHPVFKIQFAGKTDDSGIDLGRLRRAVSDRFGATPAIRLTSDLARLVEAELALRGYRRARVTPHIELEHAPDRATIVLAIEPGTRSRIGAIEVVGSVGVPASELLDRLAIVTGAPYEIEALNARIETYLADWRRGGHYEARLTATPFVADEGRRVDLTLAVEPGPRVRIVFTGDLLPADAREDLVPIAREGSTDEDLLEDSSIRIEEYLRAQGYRDAAAPHAREESDGELMVTFAVKKGPQYRIAEVEIGGNVSLPRSELDPGLRLRPGQPFVGGRLDAGVAAIQDLYRRRGFAAVRVRSSVDPLPATAASSQVAVIIRIVIIENVQTIVGSLRLVGNRSVPEASLLEGLGLRAGSEFVGLQMAADRDAIQLKYGNLGYLNAIVEVSPGLSADSSLADIVFTVQEGSRMFVDHVLIVGNVRTGRETIERELQIRPGDPLGLAALTESHRRITALGLFRRTRITQLAHGNEALRDVVITVEEVPPTTVGYGGGFEVSQRIRRGEEPGGLASEQLEFAPRAFFEITRRNLFGKNRTVNFFTRISLRSKNVPTFPTDGPLRGVSDSGYGFSEYRVLGTFREPQVFGIAATAFLTATIEQQIRSSFNFARRAFDAALNRRISRAASVSGSYQVQSTRLFDERVRQSDRPLIDRLFPQVLLASFSASGVHDTRDDQLGPSAGQYFSAIGQLAARPIGSEVGFVKSYFTAQLFRTLSRSNGIVVAGSARIGMATGFPRDVVRGGDQGESMLDPSGQPIVDVVKDLPASERFFAGGDTTVRGFAIDQLGTPDTIDKDGIPIGGSALVIFNVELRVPVGGGVGVVGFFDSGNVFERTTDIDLGQLRSAVGLGLRYRSPVGPIRLDIGFKVNRRDLVPGRPEKWAVWHISLGQAF